MTYEAHQSPEFGDAFAALPKAERQRVSEAVFGRLSIDPTHNTKLLAGKFAGLRSFRVGDYRVIVFIVEEVRQRGMDNKASYLDCTGLPEKGLKLMFVGPRKNVYKWSP